jgi:hypothetical protein
MSTGTTTDLSSLSESSDDYVAGNGETLTGKLGHNRKITIAAGAIVKLNNVSINFEASPVLSGTFAGINCLGNATLIISGENNKVKGFADGYPGIFVPSARTLTITGSGTLYALGHANAAAIGSGKDNITAYRACGNIVLQGGTIWATGGSGAAGIGSGATANYVEPQTGTPSSCGNITIKNSVTHVYATKGAEAESIGKGQYSTCGTVTIEDPGKVTKY